MKKSRFTEKQIVFALKQMRLGRSDTTFYTWRKKYGGISPSELKRTWQREEENLRLKKLVFALSPDKTMLQTCPQKRTDAGASA